MASSCIRELASVRQDKYSVHLYFDCGGGGVPSGVFVWIQQQRDILPGVYLKRPVELFDDAREGTMRPFGKDGVEVEITSEPKVKRTYRLKPWLYF